MGLLDRSYSMYITDNDKMISLENDTGHMEYTEKDGLVIFAEAQKWILTLDMRTYHFDILNVCSTKQIYKSKAICLYR